MKTKVDKEKNGDSFPEVSGISNVICLRFPTSILMVSTNGEAVPTAMLK